MRNNHWLRGFVLLALACVLAVAGVVLPAGCAQKAIVPGTPPATHSVELDRNISYYDGPGSNPAQNNLDLYLPQGAHDFPVVVFVHGGAWTLGDKMLGEPLGNTLAARGIAVASINYRLAPAVQNPDQARDVARAFAWVHDNIASRGGNPDSMFLSGHSAGGQLVALVALDQRYLQEQGLAGSALKGAVPLSGVYDMQEVARFLGSLNGTALADIFGSGAEVLTAASPIDLVRADAPPFLVLWASEDIPSLPDQAQKFVAALQKAGAQASGQEIPDRLHTSILSRIGSADDPATAAIFDFLRNLATFH